MSHKTSISPLPPSPPPDLPENIEIWDLSSFGTKQNQTTNNRTQVEKLAPDLPLKICEFDISTVSNKSWEPYVPQEGLFVAQWLIMQTRLCTGRLPSCFQYIYEDAGSVRLLTEDNSFTTLFKLIQEEQLWLYKLSYSSLCRKWQFVKRISSGVNLEG